MEATRITLPELIELRRAVSPPPQDAGRATLAERFLLPPFSVLDARQGYWQKRKKMWLALGIQSELGRGANLQPMAAEDLGGGLNNYRNENNGLLGISKQARSHYKPNATPTGRAFPSASIQPGAENGAPNEKYARGDGRGRPLASTFGSGKPGDLAAGFRGREGAETPSLEGGLTHGTTIHHTDGSSSQVQSGTSIFDPVLCELAYRWFCPQAGRVLDPFAGGSVRGIVAAKLGREYAGVDLRPEQADANYAQAECICPDADIAWAVGDSCGIGELLPGQYDLVFSCPPYADLERYSDDPRDLSTMGYAEFIEAYRAIIAASCAMLKDDRFAVFVVGDIRDRATGNYRGFVGDTVEAFRAAGLELYNEAVLVTAVGSLPIRVGRQFAGYRKLGKTHQNVLVFLKGDAGRAAAACGEVDVDDLPMPPCAPGAVAVCAQDITGLASYTHIDGDDSEVQVVPMNTTEACLLGDVMRGEARAAGLPAPRMWVGRADGWARVDEGAELTYIIGGKAYLSRELFPDAAGPVDVPPPPRKLRG